MTTIPRYRQTTDYELLVIARVIDLIGTLDPEGKNRAISYILQRKDNLPAPPDTRLTEANGGAADEPAELFATGGA